MIFACKIKRSIIGYNKKIGVLSGSEIRKLKRFKNKNEANLFLVGKLLTRKSISAILNVNPKEIIFKSDKYGRPSLNFPRIKNLDFNLSHSGKWVVLAIGYNKIGIDIEKMVPIDFKIANNYFHKEELKFLYSQKKEKKERFYTLWTLKESFIKSVGKGLSLNLKSFYFEFKKNGHIILRSKLKQERYFKMYDIDKKYKLSLCLKNNEHIPKKVEFIDLSKI